MPLIDARIASPATITAKSPTGATLLTHTYTYKESTNDTPLIQTDVYTQSTTTDTTTYGYDPLGWLLKAATTGTHPAIYVYELDGAGNRKNQTSTPKRLPVARKRTTRTKPAISWNAG